MGVSRSYAQVAGKLQKAGAISATVPRVATREAVTMTATIIKSGAPKRLRNVGKKGANLGVRTAVTGTTRVFGYVKATGPWPIIESDTKAHTIPKARRRAKKTLRFPDGSFRREVQHPGTKGKHLFEKGAERARPLIPRVYQRAEHQALARVF